MRVNHVKQRLKAGQPSLGTWLALPSPEAVEYIATLPFDWLVVDTEHNPIDIRTLGQMFIAMRASGVAPMVRIPWNDPENFKRVLDAGAWGIVVPMVNSRAEAEAAVHATRYPLTGGRSVGGGRHGISFDAGSAEYYRYANEQVLLVVQIEHIDGVNNIDDILSVPGVDACFIGPNDLAASMGIGLGVSLESDHPELVDAIRRVREGCLRHGVPSGIHTSGGVATARRIAEGFQFCALSSELGIMLQALAGNLKDSGWTASPRGTIDVEKLEGGAAVRY